MIVEWMAQDEYAYHFITQPKPAKEYMPSWYKNLTPFHGGQTPNIEDHRADVTEKLCMPLLDTFTSGYIQEAWCDINIRLDDEGRHKFIGANKHREIVIVRPGANKIIPKDSNYSDSHVNWLSHWEPKLPSGWSTYYSHPFNQYDLPFRTIDGIIDSDKWWIGGSVPFLLKNNFEGVIPQGTPLYQMLFFKRENWQSKTPEFNEISKMKLYNKIFNSFYGGYRKHIWSKKNYE